MSTVELRLFQQVAQVKPLPEIACLLGLHPNTVNRWVEMQSVPEQYAGDFRRMLGLNGNAKDQFYTKPAVARSCYRTFRNVAKSMKVNLSRHQYIEPSAGCGWFYRILPKTRRIGIDLEPRGPDLIQADYLRWTPPKGLRYIVIGNPPFGLRGHLALQFINHSAEFADMVAFILPQLFESDGKGVPSKRVDRKFRLAYSEKLPAASFEKPDGSPVNISTVFQVWTAVNHQHIRMPARKTCTSYIRVFSLSNGGTPSSTRNKHMIGKCDVYLPSTCFSGMKAYRSFGELPNRRGYGIVIHRNKRRVENILMQQDWKQVAFPSTNGALNLRRSLIEGVLTSQGLHDRPCPPPAADRQIFRHGSENRANQS